MLGFTLGGSGPNGVFQYNELNIMLLYTAS